MTSLIERILARRLIDKQDMVTLLEEAAAAIEARDAEIAALKADMPTIWEDPAGKGYPCVERPMTPAEARETIERMGREIGRLRKALERDVLRLALLADAADEVKSAAIRKWRNETITALKEEAS